MLMLERSFPGEKEVAKQSIATLCLIYILYGVYAWLIWRQVFCTLVLSFYLFEFHILVLHKFLSVYQRFNGFFSLQ